MLDESMNRLTSFSIEIEGGDYASSTPSLAERSEKPDSAVDRAAPSRKFPSGSPENLGSGRTGKSFDAAARAGVFGLFTFSACVIYLCCSLDGSYKQANDRWPAGRPACLPARLPASLSACLSARQSVRPSTAAVIVAVASAAEFKSRKTNRPGSATSGNAEAACRCGTRRGPATSL